MDVIMIYLGAGLMAGFVSGLFGLGGGLTVVPALVIALPMQGVAPEYVMHLALGTSLGVLLVTAARTTMLRHARGDLDWPLVWRYGLAVLLGAALGSVLGNALPGEALRAVFIGFVGITLGRALWRRWRAARAHDSETLPGVPRRPGAARLLAYGVPTGIAGALLGMGAAILTVPFLRQEGYTMPRAAAVAAAMSVVIGLGAGVGYILGGIGLPGLPDWTLGYLYLPAFAGLLAGAMVGAPLGVRASHALNEDLQSGLFVCYLLAVLVAMLTR
jgi:uncharacterized membrane protein YfcA